MIPNKIKNLADEARLEWLYDRLPAKPYHGNSKSSRFIAEKSVAINAAYIQMNHPAVTHFIVQDIDDRHALYAYEDKNAPPPQLIVHNPKNGHAHYIYFLAEPVGRWGASSPRAIAYLDSITYALRELLGADKGFSGSFCKNPYHLSWNLFAPLEAPSSYELGELADWLDLPSLYEVRQAKKREQQAANDAEYSRNVALFNAVRVQAYKLASKGQKRGLFRDILALAEECNALFDERLPANEVLHTARSIYRYCSSKRFKGYAAQSSARFSALQAARGAKSKRPTNPNSARSQKPWESLGISRATYYRRLKSVAEK